MKLIQIVDLKLDEEVIRPGKQEIIFIYLFFNYYFDFYYLFEKKKDVKQKIKIRISIKATKPGVPAPVPPLG